MEYCELLDLLILVKRKITALTVTTTKGSYSTWCLLSSILQLIWSMINSVGGQIFQDSWNIGGKHTLNNEHQVQKYKSNKKSCQDYNIFISFWELHNGYHAITITLTLISVSQETTVLLLPRVYRISWKFSGRLKDGNITRIQESKAISPLIQYLQNSLFSWYINSMKWEVYSNFILIAFRISIHHL